MKFKRLKDELKNPAGLEISLEESEIKAFQAILNRALNTWPDAPADWKSVADLLEFGRVLQPYTDKF